HCIAANGRTVPCSRFPAHLPTLLTETRCSGSWHGATAATALKSQPRGAVPRPAGEAAWPTKQAPVTTEDMRTGDAVSGVGLPRGYDTLSPCVWRHCPGPTRRVPPCRSHSPYDGRPLATRPWTCGFLHPRNSYRRRGC